MYPETPVLVPNTYIPQHTHIRFDWYCSNTLGDAHYNNDTDMLARCCYKLSTSGDVYAIVNVSDVADVVDVKDMKQLYLFCKDANSCRISDGVMYVYNKYKNLIHQTSRLVMKISGLKGKNNLQMFKWAIDNIDRHPQYRGIVNVVDVKHVINNYINVYHGYRSYIPSTSEELYKQYMQHVKGLLAALHVDKTLDDNIAKRISVITKVIDTMNSDNVSLFDNMTGYIIDHSK